jgi:hypothetical protein
MYNFADRFQNIQFHRVPFLTSDLLALLIPNMRNLTNLGIYKCQLLHVGETPRILEILRTDRPKGREYQIHLDFYPNFHLGPPADCNNIHAVGSYGVTWDNWNGNSTLAIWALVQRIIPQAKRHGIDIFSRHTAFRRWLDDGPCWRVQETLEALQNPTYDKLALAALVDCRNPDHHGSVSKLTAPYRDRKEQ